MRKIRLWSGKFKDVIIDVWEMENGDIVIGGIGWYEYNDYLQLKNKEAERK